MTTMALPSTVPPDKTYTGMMSEMNEKGDTKVVWNADNADEVATAREAFEKLTKKGFAAFTVKRGGEQGDRIHTFDPSAEKIILVPQLRGG